MVIPRKALATYSGARGLVASVGKRHLALFDLRTGGWEEYDVEFGKVLATTWAPSGLWILDRVGRRRHKRKRLSRFNESSGEWTIMAEWHSHRLFNRQYLTTTIDLVLASSSRWLRSHALALLDVSDGNLELAGFSLSRGRLASAPVADKRGLNVLLKGRRRRIQLTRVSDLASSPGWWNDLAQCL